MGCLSSQTQGSAPHTREGGQASQTGGPPLGCFLQKGGGHPREALGAEVPCGQGVNVTGWARDVLAPSPSSAVPDAGLQSLSCPHAAPSVWEPPFPHARGPPCFTARPAGSRRPGLTGQSVHFPLTTHLRNRSLPRDVSRKVSVGRPPQQALSLGTRGHPQSQPVGVVF